MVSKASLAKAKIALIKGKKYPGRAIERSLANEREADQRVRENADRFMTAWRARAAKNTYTPPRRDLLADRDIFQEIQWCLAQGDTVCLSSRSPTGVMGGVRSPYPAHIPHGLRLKRDERNRVNAGRPPDVIKRRIPIYGPDWRAIKSIADARRRRGENTHTFWVPRWEDTGPMLKGLAWGMVCYEVGGLTLNLNLSPAVVEAARQDPRSTFVQHLRERIKRELNGAIRPLGIDTPDFFIAVESAQFGSPHLHGAIVAPIDDGLFPVVREALVRAVTEKGLTRTGTEVLLKPLTTPASWVC